MTQRTSTTAAILGANPRFQAFIGATDEQGAAEALRACCCIKSRRELDTNPEAAERFHELRRAFAYEGAACSK